MKTGLFWMITQEMKPGIWKVIGVFGGILLLSPAKILFEELCLGCEDRCFFIHLPRFRPGPSFLFFLSIPSGNIH